MVIGDEKSDFPGCGCSKYEGYRPGHNFLYTACRSVLLAITAALRLGLKLFIQRTSIDIFPT
jgi:hypothetical protein